MKEKNIYMQMKAWFEKNHSIKQPSKMRSDFKEQLINLEPIFNTKTQEFYGAIQNDLIQTNKSQYLKNFEMGLANISYWHFHGRAIKNIFPLPVSLFQEDDFYDQLEHLLFQSQLPVGLLKISLYNYKNLELYWFLGKLQKLHRLGVLLELKSFSGGRTEIEWLESGLFSGIHLSTSFIRAASMTTYSKELFDDLLLTCKTKNFHTYGEGISLVHDLDFTRNNHIDFCYGPLLMPEVSKHQLLKIKGSQFDGYAELPVIKKNDGD